MKFALTFLILGSLQMSISHAAVILGTDFTNRTVSGQTASNITYTLTGIEDPGNLTVVENESNGIRDTTSELSDLFNTTAATGYLAPNLNVENEDGWYVDMALTFASGTTSLSITTLDLAINHFSNSGGAQTSGSTRSDWRAEIIGSTSGVLVTDSLGNQGGSYNSGPYPVSLDLTSTLNNSETWTLRIYSDYSSSSGNNAGIDSFALNGTATVIPEPSSLLLAILGSVFLLRRKRS